MPDWTPEERHRLEDKTFDYGHWIPCLDAMVVGEVQPDGSGDMLLNRSYTVFTSPKPFDWYIFGFASDWPLDNMIDTIVNVANLAEKENVSTRFLPATSLLGMPQQYNPGWLPLQCAVYEIEGVHKMWAWGAVETQSSEAGLSVWYDRSKSARFIAPFKLKQGEQLRFIVGNRCAEDFEDTTLTVIGQRWQTWGQEGKL